MAKAGFWLRGAKGKLAGAVAQKGQNGTILREIVTPKNPKTEKQIYQRAVMATVMKAYSAGKDIFDHSIQGLEKGAKTQQYFIAKNARILRSLVATELADIAAHPNSINKAEACCVAPKALYAVPNAYLISEGTYECTAWKATDEGVTPQHIPAVQDNRPDVGTGLFEITVKDAAIALNLVPGDIYTFVAIACNTDSANIIHNGVDRSGNISDEAGTKQYKSTFGYIRVQVKDDVLTNTTLLQAESEDKIDNFMYDFEHFFTLTGFSHPEIFLFDDEMVGGVPQCIPSGLDFRNDWVGSVGVIRSRLDEDLRSSSYMHEYNYKRDTGGNVTAYGISSPYILPTWQKGADSLGSSELILESDQQGGFVHA